MLRVGATKESWTIFVGTVICRDRGVQISPGSQSVSPRTLKSLTAKPLTLNPYLPAAKPNILSQMTGVPCKVLKIEGPSLGSFCEGF